MIADTDYDKPQISENEDDIKAGYTDRCFIPALTAVEHPYPKITWKGDRLRLFRFYLRSKKMSNETDLGIKFEKLTEPLIMEGNRPHLLVEKKALLSSCPKYEEVGYRCIRHPVFGQLCWLREVENRLQFKAIYMSEDRAYQWIADGTVEELTSENRKHGQDFDLGFLSINPDDLNWGVYIPLVD